MKSKIDLGKEVANIVREELLDQVRKHLLEHCLGCECSKGGKSCCNYEQEALKMTMEYIVSMARWN